MVFNSVLALNKKVILMTAGKKRRNNNIVHFESKLKFI
jgi:hypothetical protein